VSNQPRLIMEPADGLTDEEIRRRIKEIMDEGDATSCEIVMEGGKKFIATQYPPA